MRIEINKSLIPYYFNIQLGGKVFTLNVDYNQTHDLFTVGLADVDGVLCAAEPVVYGVPMFEVMRDRRFPDVVITPRDDSGTTTAVTHDNLGRTVFLTVEARHE